MTDQPPQPPPAEPRHEHVYRQIIDRATGKVVGYCCGCGKWRK